jgi:hypothetical protein
MTNSKNLTPAQLVAAWRPTVSPREAALGAIMRQEQTDRIIASIILDSRERAAERPSGYCRHGREPRFCGACARRRGA